MPKGVEDRKKVGKNSVRKRKRCGNCALLLETMPVVGAMTLGELAWGIVQTLLSGVNSVMGDFFMIMLYSRLRE